MERMNREQHFIRFNSETKTKQRNNLNDRARDIKEMERSTKHNPESSKKQTEEKDKQPSMRRATN